MKNRLFVIAVVISATAAVAIAAQEKWTAPASAAAKRNPVRANAASIGRGKTVYTAACASCHGSSGKGDGPAAKDLKESPGDMTKLGSQSDGALFWKISEGKKPMPPFATKLSDQQRWDLINYLRTLKK
jgi:mono/diheme cytochrome c family protein